MRIDIHKKFKLIQDNTETAIYLDTQDIYNYNSIYAVKRKKHHNFTVSSKKLFLLSFISSSILHQNDKKSISKSTLR
jgi:hypothetical protein